ncbi:PGN_0703 family putative restriction endonuclease [Nitriliruptor alkaliphilus]|uniref:PGN_0703 family putative restriction endonuclease n=1 Tax=Nitriliruptor alkaliphilus TaxID=427918 RepID=UPI0006988E1D|nr:hypothetical protein [Nitriliruptor alkaliphilus]
MSTTTVDAELLAEHHVRVGSDRPWQRRLRLLQALWREEQGLPIGVHPRGGADARPLGSRIGLPHAERHLGNFLTPTIREVVRAELVAEAVSEGEALAVPQLYTDLLASQPLAFNLFGELKADLDTASAWTRHLWPDRVQQVTRIEFEHAPQLAARQRLEDHSAFDVYLEHTVPGGRAGFIGFTVTYHENLEVAPVRNQPQAEEVARASGLFVDGALPALREPPLQQVWFDHLLALSVLQSDPDRWSGNGLLVFLHPVANAASYRVVDAYRRRLLGSRTFQRTSLEEVVAALQLTSGAPWVDAFHHRYLDYRRADAAGGSGT